jgi:DNA polymerase bacteriophage-type
MDGARAVSTLHIDFESRSAVDLKKTGVYRYASDPSTDLWCMAYAFDDEPVELWVPGALMPMRVVLHVREGGELAAWNAQFERVMWREILAKRYNWPDPTLAQWRCIMAESYAMALPGQLGMAAAALGLAEQKDDAGHRLMLQMAKPRRTNPDGTHVWWDDEDRRLRLYAYCRQDVEAERNAEKRLLRLRPLERQIYYLDQKINDRGVKVDVRACTAAKKIVADTMAKLDLEMRSVTGGAVGACSNVAELTRYLQAAGLPVEKVRKEQVNELLAMELPPNIRRALELRRDAGKTSTAKITALLNRVDPDGRMRGNLQYHGAATGRWAARGAQLQNLPRSSMEIGDEQVTHLLRGNADAIEILYGSPLHFVSDAVRAMIQAGPDRVLMSADFSNIEGRVLAWLAGQEDKLEAFRAFDAGEGPDLYKVGAAGIFGIPVDKVTKDQRQIGKVAELALGYQGGVMAFQAMAGNYGLKMGRYYDMIWPAMGMEYQEAALKGWSTRGKKSGIEQKTWLASEVVKVAWRAKNPRIKTYWTTLETAAIEAMHTGATTHAGRIKFKKNGSFLFCQLPSGRVLTYPYPRIESKKMPWLDRDGNEVFKDAIVYRGIDSFTKKWSDQDFYGGLSAENVTQAVARDLMAEAMLRVEAKGYPVVLTVHDELVAEPKRGHGSVEEFGRIMSELPAWAAGCPVAAAGWVGTRYRKG